MTYDEPDINLVFHMHILTFILCKESDAHRYRYTLFQKTWGYSLRTRLL